MDRGRSDRASDGYAEDLRVGRVGAEGAGAGDPAGDCGAGECGVAADERVYRRVPDVLGRVQLDGHAVQCGVYGGGFVDDHPVGGVYAEYDPIGLFKRNSCFRVNIQTFSKNQCLSMLQMNFKMSIFGCRSRFLMKFSTLLGFS